jgi:hypothetical protein
MVKTLIGQLVVVVVFLIFLIGILVLMMIAIDIIFETCSVEWGLTTRSGIDFSFVVSKG